MFDRIFSEPISPQQTSTSPKLGDKVYFVCFQTWPCNSFSQLAACEKMYSLENIIQLYTAMRGSSQNYGPEVTVIALTILLRGVAPKQNSSIAVTEGP